MDMELKLDMAWSMLEHFNPATRLVSRSQAPNLTAYSDCLSAFLEYYHVKKYPAWPPRLDETDNRLYDRDAFEEMLFEFYGLYEHLADKSASGFVSRYARGTKSNIRRAIRSFDREHNFKALSYATPRMPEVTSGLRKRKFMRSSSAAPARRPLSSASSASITSSIRSSSGSSIASFVRRSRPLSRVSNRLSTMFSHDSAGLPTISETDDSDFSGMDSASSSPISSPMLGLISGPMMAKPIRDPGTKYFSSSLVTSYIEFEQAQILRSAGSLAPSTIRGQSWVTIYAILQLLMSVTEAPTGAQETTKIDYFVCFDPAESM
jgi:hypothetical protein